MSRGRDASSRATSRRFLHCRRESVQIASVPSLLKVAECQYVCVDSLKSRSALSRSPCVLYPRRRIGLCPRRHALGSRPAMDPGEAPAANIVVGEAISIVGERLIQRDERLAASAKRGEEVRHEIGVELVGVQKQDLGELATHDID